MHNRLEQGVAAAGMILALALVLTAMEGLTARAHKPGTPGATAVDAFRQLDDVLPTPSGTRTASGAPGPEYWQQQADYEIDVIIDDEKRHLTGEETITYTNNSPHTLSYLWVQLDQNRFSRHSGDISTREAPDMKTLSYKGMRDTLSRESFLGGHTIKRVRDGRGRPVPYTIVGTMMRVDLPRGLGPGSSTKLEIAWEYNIVEVDALRARSGYEHLDDGLNLYQMAQFYPRMAAYTDVNGWQHKQFLGRGEFTLEFGDYEVRITVPDTHIVAATGELQNPRKVLEPSWRRRLDQARRSREPVLVVTPEEAEARGKATSRGTRTWVFEAENVRDFAFASCARFMWDAMGVAVGEQTVMAMSFFPREGEPLWSRYSTHAVAQALETYSRITVPYPWPVAISVNGPVGGGMEYPMISFNAPRPEDDGTYSERQKHGLISVVIHEVGHNWFPMIINTDERQWTWIDEGFNSFVQVMAEQRWEKEYPSWSGEPAKIAPYMKRTDEVPIMTASDSLLHFGENAYGKTATALVVLREVVLGDTLFDFAFKEYARRWQFKRPQPADFFRTMEDASGMDLDWFWRGWFYGTDHVDVGIDKVTVFRLETGDPARDKPAAKTERDEKPDSRMVLRYADHVKRVERHPGLVDFYNTFDDLDVTPQDLEGYEEHLEELEDEEKETLKAATDGHHFTVVSFRNHGGLVTPLPLRITYEDQSTESRTLPAEIWRRNSKSVSKLFVTSQGIASIEFDPHQETGDADTDNNLWPPKAAKGTFKLVKEPKKKNPIQLKKEAEDKAKEEAEEKAKEEAEEKAKEEAEDKEEANEDAEDKEEAEDKDAPGDESTSPTEPLPPEDEATPSDGP